MKSIKIRGMYRLPLALRIGLVIGIPLVSWFLFIGITDNVPELVAVGILFFLILIVGLGFYACYGVKITKKRVILVDQGFIKIFKRDELVKFNIIISKRYMQVQIKARCEKPCEFCFGDFDINTKATANLLFPRLFIVKYRVSDKYIEKLKSKFDGVEDIRFVVMPDEA